MKVLVAEDDYTSRAILDATLKSWGHDVVLAEDGNQAMSYLGAHPDIQMLIIDWTMPGPDGPEVCRRVRSSHRANYVYMVLLTARSDREAFLEGMEAGADDFIVKPFDAEQMRARIRVAERIVDLEERLSRQNEELRHSNNHTKMLLKQVQDQAGELERQAREDWLTGLPNRRHLDFHLSREFVRARRYGKPLAVAIADVDNFKAVNDTYSHHVGDQVLQTIADILHQNSRGSDMVGRYGGEEFVLIFPETSVEQGRIACEKIRQSVADHPWGTLHEGLRVTMSFGLSDSVHLPNFEKMLTEADDRLYEAKRKGKNSICP